MPVHSHGRHSRLEDLLRTFYTVPRVGQERLSDGGGPFGFDVTTALQVDYVICVYQCDGIVETGCFRGDTSEYLARMYPHLPVRTCDVDSASAAFTRTRLADHPNAEVFTGDSAELLPRMLAGLAMPFVYLDAHWGDQWPLHNELTALRHGVIAVDDFNIGHPRFGYDTYGGKDCGPELIADALPTADEMFVGNPYSRYSLPCLQTGRRSGTGYLTAGIPPQALTDSTMFVHVPLRPAVIMPPWEKFTPPHVARAEEVVR